MKVYYYSHSTNGRRLQRPPTYGKLKSRRYYGGIQLGRGGLYRSYGTSISLMLDEAPLRVTTPTITLKIMCGYSDVKNMENYLAGKGAKISYQSFMVEVEIHFVVPLKEEIVLRSEIPLLGGTVLN